MVLVPIHRLLLSFHGLGSTTADGFVVRMLAVPEVVVAAVSRLVSRSISSRGLRRNLRQTNT